ncbi:fumarate reductase subunit FrdD [Candidatus Desulfovibrio trichonymphae]|uniref:Fumarate reductase subunit D n=1 Tax=Candidatus Desulfovibrio trichonymphae TaxID=1725232 RepID=A0A1J1DUU1_9BACT|nr:fumarate reductase subunit FrdD [Candidatus Desulfovibrio trichonymphae]BAV91556.1 fumarate reductase subunit D [Candidatus Desulfovibrio trichonymphae]GHU89594.1 fumarate reductase subunit D [Deltaproteobacteria bacterium]GHU93422.1 fumarate reductase subunit D [Deltaproteobacteria bacterium]GHU97068.1 fumarate reductase subunit D [Deltaproteobacteria bacterium]
MYDNIKRSNEPIFWALFGAGGTFGAVCAPALILSLLILYPYLGEGTTPGVFYRFLDTFIGRLFLAVFIALTAWSGLHRLVHTLHDLKVHWSKLPLVCYGAALLITVLALYGAFACRL